MLLKAFMLLCCVASASTLSLTKEAFQTEVLDSGKNAFIKFFAPWPGFGERWRCPLRAGGEFHHTII